MDSISAIRLDNLDRMRFANADLNIRIEDNAAKHARTAAMIEATRSLETTETMTAIKTQVAIIKRTGDSG